MATNMVQIDYLLDHVYPCDLQILYDGVESRTFHSNGDHLPTEMFLPTPSNDPHIGKISKLTFALIDVTKSRFATCRVAILLMNFFTSLNSKWGNQRRQEKWMYVGVLLLIFKRKPFPPDVFLEVSKRIIITKGHVWTVQEVVYLGEAISVCSSPRKMPGQLDLVFEMAEAIFVPNGRKPFSYRSLQSTWNKLLVSEHPSHLLNRTVSIADLSLLVPLVSGAFLWEKQILGVLAAFCPRPLFAII
ncbi:hypothetical protein Fcan01_19027 [Folsomia candida]|uniref:Uncharacterized protein n=1 Tax=Folsomia candida TaxID=158441 RepID=A0A226DMT5_FOLCA|nr:hypothetical protein Fcan01_19027 [Folsomia candida]